MDAHHSNQSTVIGHTFAANDAPGAAAILIERSGFGAIRDHDLEGNGTGRDDIQLRGAYNWDTRTNFLEHYIRLWPGGVVHRFLFLLYSPWSEGAKFFPTIAYARELSHH